MLEENALIGNYRLIRYIGKGRFSEVWLAEKQFQHSAKKVRHALKFLSDIGNDINYKATEEEINTWIEAGNHPNVMSVLDDFVHKGHIVIVSEYAEGGSLRDWLHKYGGKAPSEKKALEMMSGILRGIGHLHSRRIVHRDLKPDNILLQGEFPRISDFGISRIISTSTQLTKPIGSPAYMSPEAFRGSKSTKTDIWSAGVILYEMLTGHFPYEADSLYALSVAIQQNEPDPIPDYISPEVRKIVEKALQRDPMKRYQSANEMQFETERAIFNSIVSENKEEIETIEIEKIRPQPAMFSASLNPQNTGQETVDAVEYERQKQREVEDEIARISSETEKNRELTNSQRKKKKVWFTVGIIVGILCLSTVLFFVFTKIL